MYFIIDFFCLFFMCYVLITPPQFNTTLTFRFYPDFFFMKKFFNIQICSGSHDSAIRSFFFRPTGNLKYSSFLLVTIFKEFLILFTICNISFTTNTFLVYVIFKIRLQHGFPVALHLFIIAILKVIVSYLVSKRQDTVF